MDHEELLVAIQDMFETSMEKMENRFLNHMGAMVENLQSKVEAVAEGHIILNEKLDRVETRLDNLETKVDRLEIRIDRIETKVDKLEIRMDRLETRMDRLETRMDRLETDGKSLKTDMEIVKEHVLRVDQRLNEHDFILKRIK